MKTQYLQEQRKVAHKCLIKVHINADFINFKISTINDEPPKVMADIINK